MMKIQSNMAIVLAATAIAVVAYLKIEAVDVQDAGHGWLLGSIIFGFLSALFGSVVVHKHVGIAVAGFLLVIGLIGNPLAMDSFGATGIQQLNAALGASLSTLIWRLLQTTRGKA